MQTRSPQDEEAAQAVEGGARTTAISVMHILSDTVNLNPFLNITRNREITLTPIPGPSLNLPTITASGYAALMDPNHLLPEHPELYARPVLPAVPAHIIPCLASFPLGSTTTSKPLNER